MKAFEQLVLEAMEEEFTIILWCSWFHLLNDEYKKEILSMFKWFGRKHPQGIAHQFHLRDWQNPMYKQVQVDYEEDENGPKITLTNIRCNRYQAGSLLDEIRLKAFGEYLHRNKIMKYLKDTVKIPIEGTRLFRDPTIDGKAIGKYDDMVKDLPELEGVF
jgi:hypothetical protein